MRISGRRFWLPKQGNALDEYEDAVACADGGSCCAIADGASETSFAAEWAALLVEGFLRDPSIVECPATLGWEKWLEPLQREWQRAIAWERLPWFAAEKAQAGAFSSLLGLRCSAAAAPQEAVSASASGPRSFTWEAVACGDSCLFQVRSGELLLAFPLQRSIDFGIRPALLSGKATSNQQVWKHLKFTTRQGEAGDRFLLATDALACWLLGECERGEMPWTRISALGDQTGFTNFINSLRADHAIRNDDTTLMIVEPFGFDRDPAARRMRRRRGRH